MAACTTPPAPRSVTGAVEFDSRKVGPGDLFVAVPGERVDGHDFAAGPIAAGAVARAGRAARCPVPAGAGAPGGVVRWQGTRAGAGDTDGSGAAVLAALARWPVACVDRLTRTG